MDRKILGRTMAAALMTAVMLPACAAGSNESGSEEDPGDVGLIMEQLSARNRGKPRKANLARAYAKAVSKYEKALEKYLKWVAKHPNNPNPPDPPTPPPPSSGQLCIDTCTAYTTAPCFGYTQAECEVALCDSLQDGACVNEFTAFVECAAQAQIDCEASTYGYPGCDELLGEAANCAAANQL